MRPVYRNTTLQYSVMALDARVMVRVRVSRVNRVSRVSVGYNINIIPSIVYRRCSISVCPHKCNALCIVPVCSPAVAGTHSTTPQRDGQAELT